MTCMSFLRRICSILLVIGLYFFCAAPVSADDNFGVSLVSTYTVTPTGSTIVEQQFTLTNKKPTLFVKQYAVEFGSSKLKNVRVFNKNGPIEANVVSGENKTSIGITFDDKIVGEGKNRTFTIQFENQDSAVATGNVLELYVPKLSNAKEYDNYKVVIKTPQRYGIPVRISPSNYQFSGNEEHVIMTFPSIGEQSISALFGEQQVFSYTLNYNLENPTTSIGLIQIALPPDTSRQKVQYTSLEPSPKEITRDKDGNWIATYEIAAEKKLDVILKGKAIVALDPRYTVPGIEIAPLTQPQKFWETDRPEIQELAKKYKTPKEIYDYVTATLSYNYNKINGSAERLGALTSLTEPTNAACQEFTDLYIAIARAAGIPARRATGYAYTANSRLRPLGLVEDVLHAWPEYYDADKKDWVPIDPTWGNTTGGINYFDQFDFNHMVFAINGSSSITPYAAGSYKRSQENTKDVNVEFGTDTSLPQLDVVTTVKRQQGPLAFLTNKYDLTITNRTGSAWYDLPIKISSNDPAIHAASEEMKLDYLLPFQSRTITFQLQGPRRLTAQQIDLTVQTQDLSSKHVASFGPASQDFFFAAIIGISVGLCVVLLALITRGLLVPRRAR